MCKKLLSGLLGGAEQQAPARPADPVKPSEAAVKQTDAEQALALRPANKKQAVNQNTVPGLGL